jgi:NCS1 family nucleobase:cation symporter-1
MYGHYIVSLHHTSLIRLYVEASSLPSTADLQPLALSCFTSIFWFGIQAVWGGQAVNLMLGAMSPAWKNAPSKFPASANITHQDFTGVMLWYFAFVPLVLLFPPEKLQKPFIFSSAAFGATLIGLLGWAVSTAGGGGPLFKTANTSDSTSFSMMLGITSILSSWGAGTIGQSDWVGPKHSDDEADI